METSSDPTRPTTARMGKVSKELPNDYALYVVECNNKLKAAGEKNCTALPEHLWRASIKGAGGR